jgi:nucleoside-diphosphate-sugar epimerase
VTSRQKKTFLVTGGAGFIGSNLADALLARGDRVRILDNLSTGKRSNIPAAAELVEGDITNFESIRSAFADVDGVFHCAALPRVQFSIDNPIESHAANINGTLNTLLAARDAGVKRLVYSASSSAYGDSPVLPQVETQLPRPKSPYGLQKYVGEHYTRLFAELYNLETVSLRYFNVYGPRMASEGAYVTVLSIFIRQKLAGQPLTVAGDGTQTRAFTHVRDVVDANLRAMNSSTVGTGEVLNIGGKHNYSVNEVAALFGGPIEHIAPRIEPHDSLPDTSRAHELLGWESTVEFLDGVAELRRLHGLK